MRWVIFEIGHQLVERNRIALGKCTRTLGNLFCGVFPVSNVGQFSRYSHQKRLTKPDLCFFLDCVPIFQCVFVSVQEMGTCLTALYLQLSASPRQLTLCRKFSPSRRSNARALTNQDVNSSQHRRKYAIRSPAPTYPSTVHQVSLGIRSHDYLGDTNMALLTIIRTNAGPRPHYPPAKTHPPIHAHFAIS